MKLGSGIRKVLRHPPGARAVERDVDAELAFHVETRVDVLMARGLTRDAADAQARRDALIAAARLCFARAGYFVPLEDIADAAGVGRGTFYRNFKDRMALALAVFEQEIERMRARLDPALLAGWRPPEVAAYKGGHGMLLQQPRWREHG